MKETGMSRDVNSESESTSRDKAEPENRTMTFEDRAARYMGSWSIAKTITMGLVAQVAFSGISRAEGVSPPGASGFALVPMDSKGLTDQRPSFQVVPDQRANCIEGLPERKLSQDTAGSSDPDGTNKNLGVPDEDSPLRKLWPHLAEDIDKWAREGEQASNGLHQGEAQGKDERETALDFRSRKVTPGEKTSRSVTEVHPNQLKQDKSERAESSEKKETIWQDLNKMLNTEEMREGIKKLMQNKTAMEIIDKATSNEKFMAGLNDLAQNDEAKKALKAMMESEGFKELAVSQLKDEAGVRRALKAVANGTLTNECYKAYKNFFSYQECCHDQKDIPRCDENFRIDWKHTGELVGGLAGAAALAICCCCYCCIKAINSKSEEGAELHAACAEACCEVSAYSCCCACYVCAAALGSGD